MRTRLLLLIYLGLTVPVKAQELAAHKLDSCSLVLGNLVPELNLSLSLDVQTRLTKHSINSLTKEIADSGNGLYFFFTHGFLSNRSITFEGDPIPTDIWTIDPSHKGEGQQGLMVKKYLEFLFPKASFGTKPLDEGDPRKTVKLNIEDNAETQPFIIIEPQTILEMSVLKAGNPGSLRVSRDEIRKTWGLPPKSKVAHVYMGRPSEWTSQEYRKLARTLKESLGIDILFVSFGNHFSNRFGFKDTELSSDFDHFENLSDLRPVDFRRRGTKVVYNDVVGLMPQLYALADLAVIIGPVNFFEPLNMGTKTVLFTPADISSYYASGTLNDMIEVAQRTSGFRHTRLWTELAPAIEQLNREQAPISPAFIETVGQPSAWFNAVSKIEGAIRRQLGLN